MKAVVPKRYGRWDAERNGLRFLHEARVRFCFRGKMRREDFDCYWAAEAGCHGRGTPDLCRRLL